MGTVYRARDPILDRPVALKTISSGAIEKADVRLRFEREARAAARLQHPNIVTIFELGEVDGTLFIAMELLEGMDLAQAMTPPDRLTTSQKLRLVVDLCRGLDYAHKHGVLHRDVKPANVRVLRDNSIKIVDFGIARVDDAAMTQTGIVLGTPGYMSPETLRGLEIDHRADMWSVGVLLYELLAGRRPFQADTFTSLAYKIVGEPAPPLHVPLPGKAGGLAAIVEKALAKRPSDRFRDLAEMGDALEMVLGLTPSGERPPTAAARQETLGRHLDAAERLLRDGELESALNEARRAQALDPSNDVAVALVRKLEERLASQEPTVRMSPAEVRAAEPTRVAAAPPAARARAADDVLASLQSRGAGAFREAGLFGEPPATSTGCLSPTRDLLATAGTDGAIRLWDLATQRRVAVLRTEMHRRTGHDAAALSLAFSADGASLASGHVDGSVRLWDVAGAREVKVKLRHEAMVAAVAFSPDGGTLASGGMDSNLKLWELRAALQGEARRELLRQPFGVTALSYAGERSQLLVTGHAKAVLRVIDARSGRLVATLRGPEGQISHLVSSPDGRRLAVLSQDRSISVFDLETRAARFHVEGHRTKQTTSFAFFAGGRLAASVALDNAVQLWEIDACATLATLWGQAGESYSCVALPKSGGIVAALSDGRVRTWGRSD
jgi:hypothetical protein